MQNFIAFDFYIPEIETIIEFDGIQHFDPDSRWWQPDAEKRQKEFELLKLHDWLKDEWCNENDIKMLRISFNENIQEILKKNFLN